MELRPCPFCGDVNPEVNRVVNYWVECTNCRTVTNFYQTKEDAITAWNTRESKWDKWKKCPHPYLSCTECRECDS